MFKKHSKIITAISTLVVLSFAFLPHAAHASTLGDAFGGLVSFTSDSIISILSILAYAAMTIASFFLTICGTILNASMNLTLHIKQLLDVMPAVYTVWAVVRDISSMAFIFFLLYAAFILILGIEDRQGLSINKFIKDLVVAGVLINFSFFLVGIAIDMSNVVSLQFYNAIAPGKDFNLENNGTAVKDYISQAFNDGGISNVFMQALSPQSAYSTNGALTNGNTDMNVLLAGIGGTVIMVLAGLSFLVAAGVFIIRTGMLLVLLALSPLWMAGMVIPRIKAEFSDPWMKALMQNLLVMPVYLAFTYIAMRILLGDNPPTTAIAQSMFHITKTGDNTGVMGATYIGMIMSYAIAMLFVNFPLYAAAKVGGSAVGWATKGRGYLGQVTQKAWNTSGGRVASRIAQNEKVQNFAGNWKVGELALKATRGVAKPFNENLKKNTEAKETFSKTLTDKAAIGYANRISSNKLAGIIPIPNKIAIGARKSTFYTLARDNRVAAARILNTRKKELIEKLNSLTKERDQLNDTIRNGMARGIAPTAYQQQRLDELSGTVSAANPTGKNLVTEAQFDITGNPGAGTRGIDGDIADFQTNVGASTKDTDKRNY